MHFHFEGYYHEADTCPNCGNDILVELESIPLPSVAAPPSQIENPPKSAHSPDSAGSSSSGYLFSNLLNSFKISPASKRYCLFIYTHTHYIDMYFYICIYSDNSAIK